MKKSIKIAIIVFVILLGIASLAIFKQISELNLQQMSTERLIYLLENYENNPHPIYGYYQIYAEIFTRFEESQDIPVFLVEVAQKKAAEGIARSTSNLVLLEENALPALELLDTYIMENSDSITEASQSQIQVQLFLIGVLGEDASCAMENVVRVTQLESPDPAYMTDDFYRDFAYWVVEQLLGDNRNFSLPSDEFDDEYGEWMYCDTPTKGDQDICSFDWRNPVNRNMFLSARLKTILGKQIKEREYYYIHLEEDNEIIKNWWETEGKYQEWGECGE